MKKSFKIIGVLLVVLSITLLSGCGEKRKEVKFEGEEGTLIFNLKESGGYKISTKKDDLRTSREQAVLIGKNFKIGIEFNGDYKYFFDSDFKKLKDKRKDNEDYKEVKYSDIDGIQYFYGSYNDYEVILPCGDSKEYYLNLSVYGDKDTEEAAKAAIKDKEVQDVLNHITTIKAVK